MLIFWLIYPKLSQIVWSRLSKILKDYEKNKNLEKVISTHKPPIFWKDKDAVKTQVKAWSSIKIDDLVFKINDLELLIKKNQFINNR
jgi:DNA polymerase-3 subunit delta